MTYGCQTWSLTKDIVNKMEVSQRKMERKMLGIKQIDRIPNLTIRERTKVDDILKVITKTKWKWAGHVARMSDNRWTVRCTEWQVRHGRRSRGRPRRRWQDDIRQWQGATWTRKAKDRDLWRDPSGGLLPTMEGRSLSMKVRYSIRCIRCSKKHSREATVTTQRSRTELLRTFLTFRT